jgi:hypothetical protein
MSIFESLLGCRPTVVTTVSQYVQEKKPREFVCFRVNIAAVCVHHSGMFALHVVRVFTLIRGVVYVVRLQRFF